MDCGATLRLLVSSLSYVETEPYVVPVSDAIRSGEKSYFPPRLDDLMAWSACFRSGGTFRNYLGYVRTGCIVVGASTTVFGEPALVKAKATVDKSGLFSKREPLWLRREIVEKLVQLGAKEVRFKEAAMLFLFAYAFLLRTPSEAIPATVGTGLSAIELEGHQMTLLLKRRKNKPQGSKLVRSCWCAASSITCPLHVFGPWVDATPRGSRVFPNMSSGGALHALREMLSILGIPKAEEYRTHDLRRGHAKDLQVSGLQMRSFGMEHPLFSVIRCAIVEDPCGG